jgi:DNA repair exonuclease SbcCD ATPase subunit
MTQRSLIELNELSAQKIAARDAAQASHARFSRELEAEQDKETTLRALVKSGDVAASELAKPQAAVSNLRALVAELESDIAALDGEIITIKAEIEEASELAELRAYATTANTEAGEYHGAIQNEAVALQSSLERINIPFSKLEAARADFNALVLRRIARRPRIALNGVSSGMGAARDSQIAHAQDVLREVEADGTSVENVRGAVPNSGSFSNINAPKSDVEITAPLASKMTEIFHEKGKTKLA